MFFCFSYEAEQPYLLQTGGESRREWQGTEAWQGGPGGVGAPKNVTQKD